MMNGFVWYGDSDSGKCDGGCKTEQIMRFFYEYEGEIETVW